ncbi:MULTISPECIES: hypothetical protein [Chryseobacterium]|uniref:DUF4251 domain-containing protein n=1 Tax=Chryseobacterium camelliae TaxID=1265445 RepID=A0ABU0TE63_9FLAO|nr:MULTISPECIES: hypothetical protein [Chryseobacterium]MDT3406966.1 hypothetical protein [Pseudacidovorax intermedius]MDQ1095241.1 hypothetical protein [Chryseobacterium camelliae]MDQ1099179.1 hypothetical protein [Chryseobacterium sp. SORGH_AS_1048]MDR6086528.1 hypothetical protein [Chryseobacterium sp. SORGH_AS_0909]MDR6130899.1 hypothetical protein [Chryseobacterium sp. SORGH_AS_1175]
MKKTFLFAVLAIAISTTSTSAQVAARKKEALSTMDSRTGRAVSITFREAKNYFTNNTAKPAVVKIATQEEFDKYFGAAATMKSKPTEIDFSKEYVLAVIGQESKNNISMKAQSVVKKADGKLVINYRKSVGKKQTYTIIPSIVLIVNKRTAGEGSLSAVEIK